MPTYQNSADAGLGNTGAALDIRPTFRFNQGGATGQLVVSLPPIAGPGANVMVAMTIDRMTEFSHVASVTAMLVGGTQEQIVAGPLPQGSNEYLFKFTDVTGVDLQNPRMTLVFDGVVDGLAVTATVDGVELA
jgi:hypothetical protein